MARLPALAERYSRRSARALLCVFEPGICEIFTLRRERGGGAERPISDCCSQQAKAGDHHGLQVVRVLLQKTSSDPAGSERASEATPPGVALEAPGVEWKFPKSAIAGCISLGEGGAHFKSLIF